MLISREEAEKRLTSENNLINRLKGSDETVEPEVVDEKAELVELRPFWNGGRRDSKNIPDFLKEIIGTTAHLEKASNVADAFDVSLSSVENFKHARSGDDREKGKNRELRARIEKNLGKIRDTAMNRLMESLNLLTEEKVGKCSAKDISSIAANMSKVVNNVTPEKDVDPDEATKLIIYAPTINQESHYKVVEVDSGATD